MTEEMVLGAMVNAGIIKTRLPGLGLGQALPGVFNVAESAYLHGLNIKPVIRRPEEDNFKPEPHHLTLTWRYEDEENLTGFSRVYNIMNLI